MRAILRPHLDRGAGRDFENCYSRTTDRTVGVVVVIVVVKCADMAVVELMVAGYVKRSRHASHQDIVQQRFAPAVQTSGPHAFIDQRFEVATRTQQAVG